MIQRARFKIIFFILYLFFIAELPAYGESGIIYLSSNATANFLYSVAEGYFEKGNYNEALHEFKKTLLIDPNHRGAQEYIDFIMAEQELQRKEIPGLSKEEREEIKKEEIKKVIYKEKAILIALEEAKRKLSEEVSVAEITPEKAIPKKVEILPEREEKLRREIQIEAKRPGIKRYYIEGEGFKITDYLGLAARVEIFEEPNPIDDYILEAKELNRTTKAQRREMITPLFTQASAERLILDYKDWPRLTYTFDKRVILHEYGIKYGYKDQAWQTHEFDLLYTLPRIKPLGILTLKPVYKRISLSSEDDRYTAEDRDEYILNLSLIPTEDFEIYTQFDYYEGKKLNTTWVSKPEQFLYKLELRKHFPKQKLSIVPGYSHSRVEYIPTADTFTKQEIYFDLGKDITAKLKGSSKLEFILSESEWPGKSPSNVDAKVSNLKNKLSYELSKNFYISSGLDWSHGLGFSDFDNFGLIGEMEYFKPGLLRWKLGYTHTKYFNLNDDLDTIYFKIYFFM